MTILAYTVLTDVKVNPFLTDVRKSKAKNFRKSEKDENITRRGFDSHKSSVWAQHAFTAPRRRRLEIILKLNFII